ncbi:hypothetical protein PIB30_091660, partial [Stylosanthes scabra]|nr:hypothetical protein [Stylosanthes scabra]
MACNNQVTFEEQGVKSRLASKRDHEALRSQVTTHMRGNHLSHPRICAAHFCLDKRPTHTSETPRICISSSAYAWLSTSSITLRRGQNVTRKQLPRICVDISLPLTHMRG